jgi:hypothetical protein
MSTPLITTEQIPLQLLSTKEVLDGLFAQKKRKHQLQKAAQLNRLFYCKVKIVFETADGKKEVTAHIIKVTDSHVMLKGGINIPVCCICEVFRDNDCDAR